MISLVDFEANSSGKFSCFEKQTSYPTQKRNNTIEPLTKSVLPVAVELMPNFNIMACPKGQTEMNVAISIQVVTSPQQNK